MKQDLFLGTAILGDCLDEMGAIKDKSVDMILCDLPYGTTQNKWDSVINLPDLWAHYERIIKDNGAIVLTAARPFTSVLVLSNLKIFKYPWVWNKRTTSGFLNAKKQPLRQHEDIAVFYKSQPTYNPQFHSNRLKRVYQGEHTKKNSDNYGKQLEYTRDIKADSPAYPKSIIEQTGVVNNSGEKVGHPTQKPVALFEYLIKTYTNVGGLVLDNCAGSFTTAIACINTGRKWICIEKDENYYKLGVDRVNKEVDFL